MDPVPAMSLSVQLGPNSLVTLGVSIRDVALLYDHGRKVGNFFRASKNEQELLESIMEDEKAILQRRGLVETVRMESRWKRIEFIYQGHHVDNLAQPAVASKQQLSKLGWLMVTVITALDVCLPHAGVQSLLMNVWQTVLGYDQEKEDSLRVQLPTSIESWRDAGRVWGMIRRIPFWVQKCRQKLTAITAVPQLNPAEREEAQHFLIWLLENQSHTFECISATVFAIAGALQQAGILLRIDGSREYETEPLVLYTQNSGTSEHTPTMRDPGRNGERFRLAKGIGSRAQLVAYPRDCPEAMINTIPVSRPVINRMFACWKLGAKAAEGVRLRASAQMPFVPSSEVYYHVDDDDPETSSFDSDLTLLAGHAFPRETQGVLEGLEYVVERLDRRRLEWLSRHTELQYLLKTENTAPSDQREDMEVWVQYQALVFGFYYRLFQPFVSLAHVYQHAFFRGVWGYGSSTFLAACSQVGQALRRDDKVSRTQLLYVLAMMYGGRTSIYSPSSTASGLLGITGTVSMVTAPLLRTTDVPYQIAGFAVVELPIIDLAADVNGELYSGKGCDVPLRTPPAQAIAIQPHAPRGVWSVHAKMGVLFGEGQPGVVMAARCNGRLVGWFSPLAADAVFLSEAYVQPRHQTEIGYVDMATVQGFEMNDQHWEDGYALQPLPKTIGVVHSKGCAALRYAAAGIYAGIGEEVSIATDDTEVAVGRVEGQDGGIVIT